ncbi:hypothetical protein L226DRAFT_264638 [Lentinus tigrinus ALCF2SS1-7]|uniref:uncharacterized protein n=1 Tax=Lentinus tigrinus ALCF2SS1-7 TaxID=1328758 RepID=UPI001165CA6E|nr:hypothetical protein L226DRAFT_264638 [Lentinus tigrinus ALCF2SS1-7]
MLIILRCQPLSYLTISSHGRLLLPISVITMTRRRSLQPFQSSRRRAGETAVTTYVHSEVISMCHCLQVYPPLQILDKSRRDR